MRPGACGFFEDRVVGQRVIARNVEIVACDSITLGPDLEVVSPGGLLARAGNQIVLAGDVAVEAGAELTLMIDDSLRP